MPLAAKAASPASAAGAASASSCYSFVNWTDESSNVVSTTACYSFTAVTNRALVATFVPLTYTVGTSSSPADGGSTSGGGTVACGSNVTVCASANLCCSFVNWIDESSNVVSTAACYSFTATPTATWWLTSPPDQPGHRQSLPGCF